MTEMQQPPVGTPAPPAAGAPARGGGLAVAALVLGLCALIPLIGLLLGLVAVVLGIVALAMKTRRKGLAAVGLVFGLIGMVETPVLLVSGLFWAKGKAQMTVCQSNLNNITKAYHMYFAEYDAAPPDTDALMSLELGMPGVFKCPCAESGRACDYFYLPAGAAAEGTTIIACDYRGNHPDGSRSVLTHMGTVRLLTQAQFQAELALAENVAFAAALKKAEGP